MGEMDGNLAPARRVATALVAAALAALAGCQSNVAVTDSGSPTVASPVPSGGTVSALALSPEGFPADYSASAAFFAEAATFPTPGVVWNGAWRDAPANAGAIPAGAEAVAAQSAAGGMTGIFVFGWRSGDRPDLNVPSDATNDWSNTAASELYAKAVASFAATYHPTYLFLGNENDYYYAQNPDDYARWIAAYNVAYDAVHAASPSTLVGPVFQYEHLSGLGKLAGMTSPNWGALSAHDLGKVDVVGLSLYPFFSYTSPGEVPTDYLSPIVDLLPNTPIVITETGWPASKPDGFEAPWVASPESQAAYAAALPGLVRGAAGADVRAVTWLYLFPPVPASRGGLGGQAYDIFGSISLRDEAGSKRPVYDVWAGLAWPANGS